MKKDFCSLKRVSVGSSTVSQPLVEKAFGEFFKSDGNFETFLRKSYGVVKGKVKSYNQWKTFVLQQFDGDTKNLKVSPENVSTGTNASKLASLLNLEGYANLVDSSTKKTMNREKANLLARETKLNDSKTEDKIKQLEAIIEKGMDGKTFTELKKKPYGKKVGYNSELNGKLGIVSSLNPRNLSAAQLSMVTQALEIVNGNETLSPEQYNRALGMLNEVLNDLEVKRQQRQKGKENEREIVIEQIKSHKPNLNSFKSVIDSLYMEKLMGLKKSDLQAIPVGDLIALNDLMAKAASEGFVPGELASMYDGIQAFLKNKETIESNPAKLADMKTIMKDVEKIRKNNPRKKLFNILQGVYNDFYQQNPNTELTLEELTNYFKSTDVDGNQGVVADKNKVNYLENEGFINLRQFVDEGNKSSTPKIFWNSTLGAWAAQKLYSIPTLIESVFKSRAVATKFLKAIGFNEFARKATAAQAESQRIEKAYFDRFEKKKANNLEFNDAYNDIERGTISFLRRTVKDSKGQASEFARRKALLQENLTALENSPNEDERALLPIYQRLWDKYKDANSIADVEAIADPVNLEAVKWYTKKWSALQPDLKELSRDYYGQHLEDDLNYIPDRFKLYDVEKDMDAIVQESFVNTTNAATNPDGTIMKNQRVQTLGSEKHISLKFNSNQQMGMHKALMFAATTEASFRMKGALKAEEFTSSMPTPEVAAMVKSRIVDYQRKKRGSIYYTKLSAAEKKMVGFLGEFGRLAYDYVLAGPTQLIKQYIPVMLDTLVVAGANFNIDDMWQGAQDNSDLSQFILKAGGTSSIRGLSSLTIDNKFAQESEFTAEDEKLLDQIIKAPNKAWKLLSKLSEKKLQFFLVNADKAANRTSWIAHYKKYLSDNGLKWEGYNGEVNQDAADYAQAMVDAAQNVSDADMMGEIFTTDNAATKAMTSIMIPFMNFAINQKARITNGISALLSDHTSSKDKKAAARDLLGTGVTMGSFAAVSYYLSLMTLKMSLKLMGLDDEEIEEEAAEYEKILKRGKATSLLQDIVPLPFIDKAAPVLGNEVLSMFTGEDEKYFFEPRMEKPIDSMGLYSVAIQRFSGLADASKNVGGTLVVKNRFTGDSKNIELSGDDLQAIRLIGMQKFLASIGIGMVETKNISNRVEKQLTKQNKGKKKGSRSRGRKRKSRSSRR